MQNYYTVASSTDGSRFVFLQGPFPTYLEAINNLSRSVLLLHGTLPAQTQDLSFTVAGIDAAGKQPTVMFSEETANAQEIASV